MSSVVEKGQVPAAEAGQMSAVETRQMKSQIRSWAQSHENGAKWVENGRQAARSGPNECHGCCRAFGTGPATTDPAKSEKILSSWSRAGVMSEAEPTRK